MTVSPMARHHLPEGQSMQHLWNAIAHDGPDHLVSWHYGMRLHTVALITSDFHLS